MMIKCNQSWEATPGGDFLPIRSAVRLPRYIRYRKNKTCFSGPKSYSSRTPLFRKARLPKRCAIDNVFMFILPEPQLMCPETSFYPLLLPGRKKPQCNGNTSE